VKALFFLEKDPVHVTVRSEDAQFNSNGRKIKTLKRRVFAKFQRGIPVWAVPLATESFDFSMMPPERTIDQWCGFYDSEADQLRMDWTDEEREAIEQHLISANYTQVARPLADVPYPTYLKQRKVQGKRTIQHAIAEIVATLETTGIDPGDVIGYESDHFDSNSQAIIEAVSAQEAPTPDEEELVAA
jgi:hypothetical protein